MDTVLLEDLFNAYYGARRNKRNTLNALAFEIDYEQKLFRLCEEIENRTYEIAPSICFINYSPVQREIFAADFRDRIVHHLVFNYINAAFYCNLSLLPPVVCNSSGFALILLSDFSN
ncbi:MAG: hypothetical protein LWX56_14040 [Ignavibacteria bacterium]|nr:hypothetical protein [Ignavibacteria bacterium]